MSASSADGVCGANFFSFFFSFYEAVTFTEEEENNKSLIKQPGRTVMGGCDFVGFEYRQFGSL